jgi:hypothetical protein
MLQPMPCEPVEPAGVLPVVSERLLGPLYHLSEGANGVTVGNSKHRLRFVAAGHIGVLRQTPNQPHPVRTVNIYFVRFSRNDVRCGLEGNV